MDELKTLLAARGAALVGFADLGALPAEVRQGYPFAVSVAAALDGDIVAGIADGPTESYSVEYDRANAFLNQLAREGARFLSERGYGASAIPATMQGLDPPDLRAAFQHKTAATLAGLGWIGKCVLLITDQYGSAVRLATILTDAPVSAGSPVTESRCGDCRACVDVCPAQACSGRQWRQGMARRQLADARACYEGMKRISRGRQTHHDICGMCIAACPWTRKYIARRGGSPPPQDEGQP